SPFWQVKYVVARFSPRLHTWPIVESNLLAGAEILVNGFNEHIRRPRGVLAESWFVFVGVAWLGGLHLLQSHSFFDRVLNAVPNDGDHVTVLEHVMFVADPAVPRNHHRPALLQVLRHRD